MIIVGYSDIVCAVKARQVKLTYSRAATPEHVLAFVKKEQNTWLPVLEEIKQNERPGRAVLC